MIGSMRDDIVSKYLSLWVKDSRVITSSEDVLATFYVLEDEERNMQYLNGLD